VKQVRWKVDVLVALFHFRNFDEVHEIFQLICFDETEHDMAQDSSATHVSSQTPLATITTTGEAGKTEGGCFRSIVSYFEIKKSALMIYGQNFFAKTVQNRTQESSVTQVSSQTPLATITSTGEAGNIEGGCFRNIVSCFENYCKEVHC